MTEIRKYIYSSPTEVISNAISFVIILSTALLQKMRARGTRDGTKCAKHIAHLMAISIFRWNQPHPVKVYYPDLYIYGSW